MAAKSRLQKFFGYLATGFLLLLIVLFVIAWLALVPVPYLPD